MKRIVVFAFVILAVVALCQVVADNALATTTPESAHSQDYLPDRGAERTWDSDVLYPEDVERLVSQMSMSATVYLEYDRFDVYIDDQYYADNTPEIDEFFDLFEPRFDALESFTGWTAENSHDQKLVIYVDASTACYGGYGGMGVATFKFSDPLYMDGCKSAYREDGQWHFDNPGELGDSWYYMSLALHETTHAITPLPLLYRLWLAEGFAVYNYNILSNFNGNGYLDITQETADYYIYQGTGYFNWEDYVANDYHDTCLNPDYCNPMEAEIQESRGYDITAWMFSMLRDDHFLDWTSFFDPMNSNRETLQRSIELGLYYTDMHVIDLFGKALGMDFETQIKPIFRYDGPDGPGWGVRQWESLDWYADLIPEISLSDDSLFVGDTVSVQASIWNNGGVSLDSVSVRFYEGSNLIDEQFVDFPCSIMTPVSVDFAAAAGDYALSVHVDEDTIKIEKSDANNDASADVSFLAWYCGDADGSGEVDIDDVVYLISYIFSGGPEPVPYESGDADCSGDIDIDDVVYLIGYIFSGGPEPGDPDGDGIPDC